MPNVEVIRKDTLAPEPAYPGCAADVGTGASACPTSSQSEECAILSVNYEDPKTHQSLGVITHQDTVDLVVKTLNMEGEVVIVDTGTRGGCFAYQDQVIDDDCLLKLTVSSSEERIPLEVIPKGVLPDLSFLKRKPPTPAGARIDTSKQLLVTEVDGPHGETLEADVTYEFSVRSFNRDFLPEEIAALHWVWKIPGGYIQACVGPQYTLPSGYPAIQLSWNANFVGKEVIVMPYMHSPSEDISVKANVGGQCIEDELVIHSRSEWGAAPPIEHAPDRDYRQYTSPLEQELKSIAVHHAGNSGHRTMREIQDLHMSDERTFPYLDAAMKKADIGYHFGIDLNGNVYEGRAINVIGSHLEGRNTGSVGVVFLGDFQTGGTFDSNGDDSVSPDMEHALLRLIDRLKYLYPNITVLGGHQEFLPDHTECPGDRLMTKLDEWRRATSMTHP